MSVPRRCQCREQLCNMVRPTCFHGDVYGGIAQVYAVVGAVVGGLYDVCAVMPDPVSLFNAPG